MRPTSSRTSLSDGLKFAALGRVPPRSMRRNSSPAMRQRQPRREHRHAERHDGQDREGDEQELARLCFTPFDVAEIVQQNAKPKCSLVALDAASR